MAVRDLLPRRRWVRVTLLALCAVLVAVAGTGTWMYQRLSGNIHSDTDTARALAADQGGRPAVLKPGAQNILLMGSDLESVKDSQRSDTTILLHLSADRRSAAAVSVPRDLMVDIPACRTPDGELTEPEHAQFNWAYERGGAACTIRTFEDLTGIRVDHHLVTQFSGFEQIVDAVGGVDVDVPEPITEKQYGITLKPGRQTVEGKEALTFVRTRLGVSDGSDLQRIERQKQFMRSLFRKVSSAGTLGNPTRLWPLLDAATSALTADPGLDTPAKLYSLVNSARSVPAGKLRIVTLPCVESDEEWGRYALVEDQAKALFRALREDRPLPGHLYNAYRSDGRPKDS